MINSLLDLLVLIIVVLIGVGFTTAVGVSIYLMLMVIIERVGDIVRSVVRFLKLEDTIKGIMDRLTAGIK